MPFICIALALLFVLPVKGQGDNHPILASHDLIGGPLGGDHHIEELRIFGDGRVIFTVQGFNSQDSTKTDSATYRTTMDAAARRRLVRLLSIPAIRSLPEHIPAKTRPIDFFWDVSLEIERTNGNQSIHVENFYPFVTSRDQVYPQPLIELECILQSVKSRATKSPESDTAWCTALPSSKIASQKRSECKSSESPRIVAGAGWGAVRLGSDGTAVQSSLGPGQAGEKYNDGYFWDFPKRGIEVLFGKAGTIRAIYFYNGQRDAERFETFCGQTDKGAGWQSSPGEIKKLYGRPSDDFSGQDSGGTWERLVFAGIDFRFENGKLVRIGIPGE